MCNYNFLKNTNTFRMPMPKNNLLLNNKRRLNDGNNLLNMMIGKYKAKEPIDCVELKHDFKKGVL